MKLGLIVFLFILSNSLRASSLESIIKETWSSDPLILSQQSKIKAAELERFARFLPNNPTVSFTDSDNHSWRTYGVSLNVGLPGKAFALHKVDNEVLRAETSEMFGKKLELASFVLTHYADCAGTKELLGILSVAVRELDTLKEAITARYEMGQSTQAERIGIELQYRQANIEYQSLADQAKVACVKLNQIVEEKKLDSKFLDDINLPEDLSESLLTELGTKSLEIIRAENESRVASAEADVSFWRAAPDFTFSYYRNYYNRLVASPIIPVVWTNTFMVSMNIPLLFPFYERSEILRARAENRIAAQRAEMRKFESQKTMEDAVNSYSRNKTVYQKLKSHDLPMAEAMVDSTLAAYRQGKLGFSELILAKRTWLDLKKEEVTLKQNILNSRLICLNSCERK